MKLSIIIVSYNTQKLLQQTLKSIDKKADWEIIVIDNNSQDGSVKMLEKKFPKVKLIKNKKNLGFASANNQGIKIAKGEYILLLNSDTIVIKNSIEKMLTQISQENKIGILSCKLLKPDGSIQPQGGYLPTLVNIFNWMVFIDDIPGIKSILKPYQQSDENIFKKRVNLEWVSGTVMMIKRKTLESIGIFNESYFMYGEDIELCTRFHNSGFKIVIIPDASIIHIGQGSSKRTKTPAIVGEFKAIKRLFKQTKPSWQFKLVRIILKLGAVLRMFVFGILQGRKDAYETYKIAYQVA